MRAPLTINGPIPFGVHRDGTPAAARLRDGCAAVVGTPGSGKTILLQNLVMGLLLCPDVIAWLIDLSKGGLTNPYIGPWRRGLIPRPAIDWAAHDEDEALGMVAALNHIVTFRREYYEEWMFQQDVDKLPLTPDLPGIELVLDEGKTATGISSNPHLTKGVTDIGDKGRGMGGRLIMSGLRGTADVIPSALMADIDARIGMSVSSKAEANYLFGWDMKPNPQDTPYPGCGLWRPSLAAAAPIPFRSHPLGSPQHLAKLAGATLEWRPALDEPSYRSLPDDLRRFYDERWARAAGSALGRSVSIPMSTGSSTPVSTPASTPPGAHGHPGEHAREPGGEHQGEHAVSTWRPAAKRPATPGVAAADKAVADAFTRAKRALTAAAATAPVRLDQTWAELADTLDADRMAGGEGWADGRQDDRRTRARQILAAAGSDGTSARAVLDQLAAEGTPVSSSVLYDWLRADAVQARHGVWAARHDPEESR